jgi:sortase A
MSVTVPREASERVPEHPNDLRIDAWFLCAEFVERVVSGARAAAGEEHGGAPPPEVDWDAIWRTGDGAPSDEAAIGRIIREAFEVARGIAPHYRLDALASPSPSAGLNGSAALGAAALMALQDLVDNVVAPAQPASDATESIAIHPEFLRVQHQPVPTPTVEPVTESGVIAAAPVAFTVTQPGSPVTEPVDPAHLGEVPSFAPDDDPSWIQPDGQVGLGAETIRAARRRDAWFHVFTWMRNAGFVVLLFVVWQLWGTSIAQHHEQSQLKNQFEAAVQTHQVPAGAANGELIPASKNFASPADGSVVAHLQIPAIGVDQYVVSGTNANDLSKGPGHYVGTALPGQAGNVAIAGHRTTHGAPFNGLGRLAAGDKIILTTTWGESLTYVVSGPPQVVSPSDVAVLNYFGDNRITLTTCNPEFSSSQRLVIVGKLSGPQKAVAEPARITYHVANSATASWDWTLLPVVGIETCLLLLLALSHRRFDVWFGSRSKWIIMVPLWAAGLYLLFGTLTNFLPSTY